MKKRPTIKIGNRIIGQGYPCFIVAEVSANHLQRFDKAIQIIKECAKAGADAIKLQTYTPNTMTINSEKKWFVVGGRRNPASWQGKTLYQLYQKAYTPWEWQPKLKKITEDLGLILFSTPFDETAVDFLEKMAVPCYKIASYEATDIPLLKKVASTKKPVIISVGFASLSEVTEAIRTLRKYGSKEIAVLHCITSYSDTPTPQSANLKTITDIRDRFPVVSGFSDNNTGIDIPVTAAIMGASIIEKHVILNRSDKSPDARFSLEPDELKMMVQEIRFAEKAIGKVHYGPANKEEEYNKRFRRSIFVIKDIKRGETFTHENIRVIRPAFGLPPKYFDKVIGKVAARNIERGSPISWNLIQ